MGLWPPDNPGLEAGSEGCAPKDTPLVGGRAGSQLFYCKAPNRNALFGYPVLPALNV